MSNVLKTAGDRKIKEVQMCLEGGYLVVVSNDVVFTQDGLEQIRKFSSDKISSLTLPVTKKLSVSFLISVGKLLKFTQSSANRKKACKTQLILTFFRSKPRSFGQDNGTSFHSSEHKRQRLAQSSRDFAQIAKLWQRKRSGRARK